MAAPHWYAKLYVVTTGQVIGADLPTTDAPSPTWDQQINQQCALSATTPVGHQGGLSAVTLRTLVKPGRNGLALCYGTGTPSDYIAQAGTIWSHSLVQENPAMLRINGAGMWSMLNARVQIPSTWTPSMGLTDARSVATYTGSYRDIAASIISNAVARGSLPIDLPAVPDGGTRTETYSGFDLTSAGQRLSELTQQNQGPDIFFRPYFATASTIRWQAMIGNPTISNAGNPLLFDHGSNLVQALTTSDGTGLATDSYVKGNGTQQAIAWAYAHDMALITGGWPLLDKVDTSHGDNAVQADLNGFATADQGLNGRTVETWDVTVRVDGGCPLGSYGPGVTASYAFTKHPWILPGRYNQRLLGLSSGQNVGEIKHIVQAAEGAV